MGSCGEQGARDTNSPRSSRTRNTTGQLAGNRQAPYPPSGRGEDGITESCGHWRNAGLTHSARKLGARHDVDVELTRSRIDSCHLVIRVVGLDRAAALESDLTIQRV